MIRLTSWSGRRVALFGLGGSGVATAKSLLAGGADVVAFDDNADQVTAAQTEEIACRDLRAIDWSAIDALVLAPGVPLTHPKPHWSVDLAMAANAPIIGDIALFADERRALAPAAPFIAITGTNGKSTTTALVAHILGSAGRAVGMGGNIGTPVLALPEPNDAIHYVVECSSYQIDLAPALDPTIGILLNLAPDHLDRHGTMEHYAAVKERLVVGSRTAIVGIDDPWCAAVADRAAGRGQPILRVSVDGTAADLSMAGSRILADGAEVADLDGIVTLRGGHNAQNAMAAVAAARLLGLDDGEIQAGLTTFPGLAHRMQPIGHVGDVLFVNDSKATNADAAAHALASFDAIYWIAGGREKEGGIASLNRFFPKIRKAYLIGEAAEPFAATLGERPHAISETLDRAVAEAARDAAAAGDQNAVVLLSPAAASFDQYRNFELRGAAFVDCAKALPGFRAL